MTTNPITDAELEDLLFDKTRGQAAPDGWYIIDALRARLSHAEWVIARLVTPHLKPKERAEILASYHAAIGKGDVG